MTTMTPGDHSGDHCGTHVVLPGRLEVILGPMFAGKTTEMLRRVRRQKVAHKRCLVVKYERDTRYGENSLSTHDQHTTVAEPVSRLIELGSLVDNFDVIGIDEGQFYPDLLQEVRGFLKKGKTVIISALDGTFEQKAFDDVLQLIPMADFAVKLTAVCAMCFDEAPFTQRLTSETKVEVIGGAEMYRPVCRKCYTECARSTANGLCTPQPKPTTTRRKKGSITTTSSGSVKRGRDSDQFSPASISFDLNSA